MLYITYQVPATQVKPRAPTGTVGLDRNVGQCTDNTGTLYRLIPTARLDAKIKRKQHHLARKQKGSSRRRRLAGQLTRLHRKRRRIRANDTHHISRVVADKVHTVVLENLHTQAMTRSARGTQENPGTQVKAKAGLNRAILASGWDQLAWKLAYQCGKIIWINPRHPSQTCYRCGCVDRANRPVQARLAGVRCGWRIHADHNAALNILARGKGASARREAFPLGTSLTREHTRVMDMQAHNCLFPGCNYIWTWQSGLLPVQRSSSGGQAVPNLTGQLVSILFRYSFRFVPTQ